MSDDPYTLSPESVFVKPPPRTLSTRIEEAYLGLLKVIVLMVLLTSLVGAIVLVYRGLGGLNAEAQPYTHAPTPSLETRFLAEVRSPGGAGAQGNGAQSADGVAHAGKAADVLDAQLDRQAALMNVFLQSVSRGLDNVGGFRDQQRAVALSLAEGGDLGDAGRHARRQADFLESVLKDKPTMDLVRQRVDKDAGYLDNFTARLLDYYPAEVRRDHQAQTVFQREESVRVAQSQAQALSQIYTALALFGGFIVLALILVLLKIERNLRSRGDVIQVMSGM